MRRRAAVLAAAALGLAATATGTALAVGAVGEDQPQRGAEVTVPDAATHFAERIKQQLSVDAAPSAPVADGDISITSRQRGANPNAARLARKAPDGGSVYVMPSNDGFCLSSTSGVEAGCYESAALDAASVMCAPGLPEGQVEVFGVAPNGVERVQIRLADGSIQTVGVQGNVYIYRPTLDAPRPLTVSATDAAGKVTTVDANVPEDFRVGCSAPVSP